MIHTIPYRWYNARKRLGPLHEHERPHDQRLAPTASISGFLAHLEMEQLKYYIYIMYLSDISIEVNIYFSKFFFMKTREDSFRKLK
jgi:hypothetical protein